MGRRGHRARHPPWRPGAALGPPGRFVLQAAIAIEHANAPTAADTSWDRIAAYYGALAALAPDPVVELNRAVAIAMAGDVAGGLARIDALAGALERYRYFHAARADLLRRLGAREAAAAAYARAPSSPATTPSARSCSAGWRRRAPDQDSRYSSRPAAYA